MSTTVIMDEGQQMNQELPGSQLARLREKKGYSQEYVAGKLHLRVRVIELLDADDYEQMPEPVFIKGYIRAYAMLLGVAPEPFLNTYNTLFGAERKLEKALWQGRRKSNVKDKLVKWITLSIAIAAVVGASLWWQKNKINQTELASAPLEQTASTEKKASEAQLTDLSKMESMFRSSAENEPTEVQGG